MLRNKILIVTVIFIPLFYSKIFAQFSSKELDDFLRIRVEMGLSDDQILKELRSNGLEEKEVRQVKVKILEMKGNKIKTPLIQNENTIDSLSEKQFEKIPESKKEIYSVFGREIFSNNQFKFSERSQIPSPANYFLGPGDVIILDLSGIQDMQELLTVSQEGFVRLKYVGPVNVTGLTLEETKNKIRGLMSKFYPQLKNGLTNITLSIKEIRSIYVTITGEVVKPGFYAVPSLSTMLNALYVSGGPNDNGSFRNIELIRGNKIYKKLDLYPLITTGIHQDDIRLESGDIIRVPFSELPVTIKGAVRRPLKYELNKGETLNNLLSYAGGFSEDAYKGSIRLERINAKEKVLLDISDTLFHQFKPNSGDFYFVDTILNRFSNSISIKGPVYRPGIYSWRENLTFLDLIKLTSGFLEDAYLERAVLYRTDLEGRKFTINLNLSSIFNKDSLDIVLQPKDEIIIKSIFDLEESLTVSLEGAVQNQGKFPWKKDLRVKDLIFLAGGLKMDAFNEKVIIYRTKKDQSFNSISFDLNNKETGEFILEANDKIVITSGKDLDIPKIVTIYGEVKAPGVFPYADSLTLQDVILLAKGYTGGATQKNIEITRRKEGIDPFNKKAEITETLLIEITNASLGKKEDEILLKPFDVITIRKNPLIQPQSFVEIQGQLLFPGKYAIQTKDDRVSNLYFRAGGSLPEANMQGVKIIRKINNDFNINKDQLKEISTSFGLDTTKQIKLDEKQSIDISVDLLTALKHPGSKEDIFLEPEDIMIIPKVSNLVIVEGEVFNPVGLGYESGKRANYYVNRAGGFKEEAKRNKTFVVFPDGSAKSTHKILGLFNRFPSVEAGSYVVVPKSLPSDGTKKFNIADLTLASSTIAGISTFIIGIVQLLK